MRVSQIRNFTWAGNVLVLGCVVCTGLHFRQARRARAEPVSGWAAASIGDVGADRWPGERAAFDVIHLTPIGGPLPSPPPPPTTKPDLDPIESFKSKLKYVAGVQFPDVPERSLALVSFDGAQLWLQPGDAVGTSGYRLIDFTIVTGAASGAEPSGAVPRIARLAFRGPDGGDPVIVDQADPSAQPLVASGGHALALPPEDQGAIRRGRASEVGPIARPSYTNLDGDWVITDDEQLWIELWGEKHVVPSLGMTPLTDRSGRPRGVRITALPESRTPLAPSHGLYVGDVVTSINGVAVNSKDEVLEYLRGPGKRLGSYKVAVETNGTRRTVTYRVPR